MLDGGHNLVTMLGGILDLSKIDQNCLGLEAMPVSLSAAIVATVEMAAADAQRRGIQITHVVEDSMAYRSVLGDAHRIRQVTPARCSLSCVPFASPTFLKKGSKCT